LNDFENIIEHQDSKTGLSAVIAIHSTQLGPALGGCRLLKGVSMEKAAATAKGLALAMTRKAALAGVSHGGGKAVIILPEMPFSRKKLLTAFAKLVDSLQGKYITAVDSGSTIEDMKCVAQHTSYVVGYAGESECGQSPSYYTAEGVIYGIKVAMQHKFSDCEWRKHSFAIKGVGSVGAIILEKLKNLGAANITIADIDANKANDLAKEFSVQHVSIGDIHASDCDVFIPSAVGGSIRQDNIEDIKAKIIAGAENNVLEDDSCATMLHRRGILYCPDYVVNAGGLIFAAGLYANDKTSIQDKLQRLGDTLTGIFIESDRRKCSTLEAAQWQFEKSIKN
jgi:leucine dehydrogenase